MAATNTTQKPVDRRYTVRLLGYAKPYLGWFALSLVIILFAVLLELYQPVLIGQAVDGFIGDYNDLYTMDQPGAPGTVQVGDYSITSSYDQFAGAGKLRARMCYVGGAYYLAVNLDDGALKSLEAYLDSNPESADQLKTEYQTVLLSEQDIKILRDKDLKGIIRLGILYFGTVVLLFGLNYAQSLILASTGQSIIYNIRNDVFQHLITLSINFFNKNPIGRLVTRVTNDAETLNEMYTSVIVSVIKSIFVLIGVMGTMLYYNVKLSLITFSVIPFIVVFTFAFENLSRKFYRAIRAKISELNGFIAEHVSGMRIVQIFAVEKETFQRFKNENETLRKFNMKQLMCFSIYSPTSYVLNIAALALLLLFGGKFAMAGTITIGTIVIFQRYIGKFFDPISELAEQFNVIQSASAAAERLFWLMDTEPEIVNAPNALHMPSFQGDIEFKNVWFAYEKDEWILKDVSFHVYPGQKVAFVGATGAGKTTIQSLICRYFDIQKGQILIDGVDVRQIQVADLRRNVGQMLQDVFLFTGDVKSNIRLNNQEITDEEVVEAAKYVNAHPFISQLDHQYDETVIERGAAFSAGQRQLLSFARTLAFEPSVLILDEATANIDTETEALIQDALNKIMTGRTTIIVAHRLSTIQNADNIIVMHKGQIRESGTHQELLAQRGMYYKLYKLQYESAGA